MTDPTPTLCTVGDDACTDTVLPTPATYPELRPHCTRLTPMAFDSISRRDLELAAQWLRGDGPLPLAVRPYVGQRERE